MTYSLTIFKNIFDNKTHRKMNLKDFDAFEKMLYDLANQPLESKKDAQLISPAVYQPDSTRSNDNVVEWAGWCAVDVDDFIVEGNLEDVLVDRFGDYRFICYSTASSTNDAPKFRLVFPLSEPVGREQIKSFWYALNVQLGDLADRQTKDLSRMYYIPATYTGAYNFIFSNRDGRTIVPNDLIRKHPMPEKVDSNNFFDRLPKAMQEQIIEYRKSKLDKEYHWSSYHDCPFWPKNLAAEYQTITSTGWYHKMYQIMVAVAGNAVKNKYAITADEISQLCRQFDNETGNWYKNRPLSKEADRALEYVYKNT